MNVNNNIPNNPINAPAIGQQNAPVDAPNIQQVAANQAPQGIDQAPAAGDIDHDMELDPERETKIDLIERALANGRTYDAAIIFTHLYPGNVQDLAMRIAQTWNNGEQELNWSTQYQIEYMNKPGSGYTFCLGRERNDVTVHGPALVVFGYFYTSLNEELENTVLRIIAEKQDLDADFRREAIEKFMPDNHPDKAELLRLCEPARFHKTKSARK